MKRIAEPTLPDELLLLALDDEKGSVIPAAAPALHGALIGAILMELALQGRIQEGVDRRLVADPTPIGDEILDDVSRRIAEANHQRAAHTWVTRLNADLPKLKDRLVARLAAAGVLEQRDGRAWWVLPTRSYPLADGDVERQARDRLRAVILDGETCDERTAALLSLVQACNLLDELFSADERPRARQRLAELLTKEPGQDATVDSRRQTTALSGLGRATRRYTDDRFRQSTVTRDTFWDVYAYQSLTSAWSEGTWEDRESAAPASASGAADGGSASGTWSRSAWADDSRSAGGSGSERESSSGGWFSWWSGGSDSSGDNSNSSGGSWWGGGASDNSASDGVGSDSGSSDSGGSSDAGSSGC